MKIIIGLGNPGEKYKNTRHNTGFMALDYLIKKKGLSWQENKKVNALMVKENETIFAKPLTFMNNSGQVVQAIMSYYKLLPKKLGLLKQKNSDLTDVLTIIHDDLDIELGKYKIAINSRSAGHNGVQSIINHLKTKNFKRLRIGIKGDKPEQMPTEKYVLENFKNNELETIKQVISKIVY